MKRTGMLILLGSLVCLLAGGAVITAEKLGGRCRTLPYLSVDKPIYRLGETVFLRAVVLQADDNLPCRRTLGGTLTVLDSRERQVYSRNLYVIDSVAGAAWNILRALRGGVYTARVEFDGSPAAVRKFEIRSYTPPRRRSQIEFFRQGYAPGEEVTATVRVSRAEGGIPTGA